jgi:hypothetical protein
MCCRSEAVQLLVVLFSEAAKMHIEENLSEVEVVLFSEAGVELQLELF